jgi:hypothetical protein
MHERNETKRKMVFLLLLVKPRRNFIYSLYLVEQ